MTDLNARELKLVQYLNEAYGKEKELETALQAHIGMTTRAPYKKRLQQHLTETKRHARELERQIKRLGGTADVVSVEGVPTLARGAAGAAVELGSRALAAAKGPLHALRGTGEQEKMLKNAKTEYADEHEEIATYTGIETLAQELGDSEVVRLARAIRREEQSMARYLEKLIPTLTKAVVQAEVPAAQRRTGGSRRTGSRRATTGSSRATRSGSRSGGTRTGAAGSRSAGSATSRSGSRSAKSGTSRSGSRANSGTSRSAGTSQSGSRSVKASAGRRSSSSGANRRSASRPSAKASRAGAAGGRS